jgi:hypothetical protein
MRLPTSSANLAEASTSLTEAAEAPIFASRTSRDASESENKVAVEAFKSSTELCNLPRCGSLLFSHPCAVDEN